MKLITLAKKLDFTTEEDYFNYCRDSYVNGNFSQCKDLFKAMTREDRKRLVYYLRTDEKESVDQKAYEFYFDLL